VAAIAVVAGLLALPVGWREATIALALPCLGLVLAMQPRPRDKDRRAGLDFWCLAIATNVAYAGFCVAPEVYFLGLASLEWLVLLLPMIACCGASWASGARRPGTPTAAWLSVVVLAVLPIATIRTLWPLRLAFRIARPGLERLADRVAAGEEIDYPRWVFPIRVAGAAADPATGNIGLMTDTNPGGPVGFVRVKGRPGTPTVGSRPIGGDDLHIGLADGWCYNEED
jgi:hypothetical protein